MIDITSLFQIIIVLLVTIITTFVIPYIKSKINIQQQEDIIMWIDIAVKAAEQIFLSGHGEEKKAYVLDFLAKKNFAIDEQTIEAAIEAAVYRINIGDV